MTERDDATMQIGIIMTEAVHAVIQRVGRELRIAVPRHYTGIDYAIYTERAEGKVYVYENGTSRGQVGTWTSGDRFRVEIESGVVKYKKIALTAIEGSRERH